MEESIIGE